MKFFYWYWFVVAVFFMYGGTLKEVILVRHSEPRGVSSSDAPRLTAVAPLLSHPRCVCVCVCAQAHSFHVGPTITWIVQNYNIISYSLWIAGRGVGIFTVG